MLWGIDSFGLRRSSMPRQKVVSMPIRSSYLWYLVKGKSAIYV